MCIGVGRGHERLVESASLVERSDPAAAADALCEAALSCTFGDAGRIEQGVADARRELRATGEKLRRRRVQVGEELTPQELQVALQVAKGKTNKEVATALFLSPKTVEFHLARVFRKLEVRSRTELARRMTAEEVATVPA